MKKFEGILICTDLDGTLLRNDKSISKENLDAIEYFKSEGGLFTFITGRMPYFVEKLYRTVKANAPIGCINGGGIYDYDNHQYLWARTLSADVIDLVEYADREIEELGIQVNAMERLYFCRENSAMERFRGETGLPNLTCHYREVDEPIGKIVFGDEDEDKLAQLAALLDKHPRADEFDFIRSDKMLYEILPKGINKGSVLPKLAELLGLDPARTIGVGDYNNDVALLSAAGLGVAVANAVPEVKAVADLVTVSNEEHAIAAIVSGLDSGEIKI